MTNLVFHSHYLTDSKAKDRFYLHLEVPLPCWFTHVYLFVRRVFA